jgi:hypothetical protein
MSASAAKGRLKPGKKNRLFGFDAVMIIPHRVMKRFPFRLLKDAKASKNTGRLTDAAAIRDDQAKSRPKELIHLP